MTGAGRSHRGAATRKGFSTTHSHGHAWPCDRAPRACRYAAPQDLGIICPIFCASCLLQRGSSRRALRRAVRSHIDQHLEVMYCPPPELEANKLYLQQVFRLLNWADDHSNEMVDTDFGRCAEGREQHGPRGRDARKLAREQLATDLAASAIENGMITRFRHYCPLGCHSCRGEIPGLLADKVNLAHLDLCAVTPALNRPTLG